MSGLFTRLAARALGAPPALAPQRPARFEAEGRVPEPASRRLAVAALVEEGEGAHRPPAAGEGAARAAAWRVAAGSATVAEPIPADPPGSPDGVPSPRRGDAATGAAPPRAPAASGPPAASAPRAAAPSAPSPGAPPPAAGGHRPSPPTAPRRELQAAIAALTATAADASAPPAAPGRRRPSGEPHPPPGADRLRPAGAIAPAAAPAAPAAGDRRGADRAAGDATEPVVRVTIGRLEVRAVRAEEPARRPARALASPRESLEDYQRRRQGGGR